MVSKGEISQPLTEEELLYIYRNEFNAVDSLSYFNGEYNKSLFVNLFNALEEFEQRAKGEGTVTFTLMEIRDILTELAEEVYDCEEKTN